jgi:hypothetical protein
MANRTDCQAPGRMGCRPIDRGHRHGLWSSVRRGRCAGAAAWPDTTGWALLLFPLRLYATPRSGSVAPWQAFFVAWFFSADAMLVAVGRSQGQCRSPIAADRSPAG